MDYEVRKSIRAKNMRITIDSDGHVLITKPARSSPASLERFVHAHRAWIEQMQQKAIVRAEKSRRLYGTPIPLPKLRRGTKAYREAVESARALAIERVQYFAHAGNFAYTSIAIRNQKTRWGSCSARGGLSFNFRIIYLTPAEADYLVVHELAHTNHHNHSVQFWKEVEKHIPEYNELRLAMHRYRF